MKNFTISEQEIDTIQQDIKENAKALVGELMKQFEILAEETKTTSPISVDQLKKIYKKIVKERVYENSRYLQKIVAIHLESNNISFIKPKMEE
jgi:flagellar biosynthesis component FlhA